MNIKAKLSPAELKLGLSLATKEEVQAGVVFNPSTGCLACQEGRQGEGGKNCWGCRLRRLQNIQNIMPWNREERGEDLL